MGREVGDGKTKDKAIRNMSTQHWHSLYPTHSGHAFCTLIVSVHATVVRHQGTVCVAMHAVQVFEYNIEINIRFPRPAKYPHLVRIQSGVYNTIPVY